MRSENAHDGRHHQAQSWPHLLRLLAQGQPDRLTTTTPPHRQAPVAAGRKQARETSVDRSIVCAVLFGLALGSCVGMVARLLSDRLGWPYVMNVTVIAVALLALVMLVVRVIVPTVVALRRKST
jgi:uncharacterized membrane protein YcjF (UPF0283 family)